MAFLEPEELNTHIYGAAVEAITDGDDSIMPQAIAAAIIEVQGYLSRYDLNDLFSKTGTDRDPFLLLNLKNIAVWHFIFLGNAAIDYEYAGIRYAQSVKWCEKVGSPTQRWIPTGWKLLTPEELSDEYSVESDCKRPNHY